jgi:hypothetical protein
MFSYSKKYQRITQYGFLFFYFFACNKILIKQKMKANQRASEQTIEKLHLKYIEKIKVIKKTRKFY